MPGFSQSADVTPSRSPTERASYAQLQPVAATDLSIGALITSSAKVCLRDDLADSCPVSGEYYTSQSPACQQHLLLQYHGYPPSSSSSTSSTSPLSVSTSPLSGGAALVGYPHPQNSSPSPLLPSLHRACGGGGGEESSSSSAATPPPPPPPLPPFPPSAHQVSRSSVECAAYSANRWRDDLASLQEVLQPRMTGSHIEDDNESVMFDITDLTFLDQLSQDDDCLGSSCSDWHDDKPPYHSQERLGYYSSSSPSSSVYSNYHHHSHPLSHPHPHHAHHLTTTSSSPSPSCSSPALYLSSSSSSSSSSSAHHRWSLHFYDSPSETPLPQPSFPPTPSPSPQHHHHSHPHHQGAGCAAMAMTTIATPATMMMMGRADAEMGVDDDDDDDDPVYKPYCESRRGAKKNLLWKFLLTVLEHRSDLAQWTDLRRGVFKFMDTSNISKLWGQRKHKNDMTFEKLSRGIRHYYKRGLMERMANTRLVYKFNWDKVPKKYRKI